jgi:hypothetical protein
MCVQPIDQRPIIAADLDYVYRMDPQHENPPYTLRFSHRNLMLLDYGFALNDYSTHSEMGHTLQELLLWALR